MDLDRVPVVQTPDIAVEIISPPETATAIHRKIDAYLKWGVGEVWLVEPETMALFVHSASGVRRLSEGVFLSSELLRGMQLQVADLFDDVSFHLSNRAIGLAK